MKTLHTVGPPATIRPGSSITREPGYPGYEVWGVIENLDDEGMTECEQVDPDDDVTPDFWSIYEHEDSGECMVVEDYQTREEALSIAASLGRARSLPAYDFTREGYRG